MADNANVAMGIGLQGQLTAPSRIFAAQEADKQYQRKLNLAAQKEKDDEVEAIKKKILLDKPKIHRLLAEDVSTKTAEALKGMVEAKQNSPNDYLSKIYDIYGNLQGTLNDAVSKSAVLNKFETDMTSTTGKEYVSSGIKNAYGLMSKANNLNEWYSKMQSAGIQNNDFFQYSPETQAFNYAVVPKVDPNAYAKTITTQHAKDPYGIEEKFVTIGGKQKKERKILYGMVDDRATADEIFKNNVKLNGGNINNAIRPFSGDEAAISYFNQPGAAQQYLDMHPEVTPENMVQHYKDNYFIPNKKNSMGIKTEGAGGINVTTNVSTGAGGEKATFFSITPPQTRVLANKNVKSAKEMFLTDSNITFQGSTTKEFMVASTGKQASGKEITGNMVLNQIAGLPVKTDKNRNIIRQNGLPVLLSEEEVKKNTVPYKYIPMAFVRKKSEFNENLLDETYITEFENVKGAFLNGVDKVNKYIDSRKEWETQYNQFKKELDLIKPENPKNKR